MGAPIGNRNAAKDYESNAHGSTYSARSARAHDKSREAQSLTNKAVHSADSKSWSDAASAHMEAAREHERAGENAPNSVKRMEHSSAATFHRAAYRVAENNIRSSSSGGGRHYSTALQEIKNSATVMSRVFNRNQANAREARDSRKYR